MCAEDISQREKLRGLYRVAKFKPGLIVLIILFSVFAALFEGIGITFIMPIIEAMQSPGDIASDASGYMQAFVMVYGFLGIPLTLAYLIVGVGIAITARHTSSFVVGWLRVALRTYYVRHLQRKAYDRALNARVAYFDREGTDDILNAIVTQAEYAGKVIRDLVRIFEKTLLMSMYLAVAFYLSWQLTIAATIMLGGLTILFRNVLEPGYTVGDKVAESNERIQENVQAGMQGIRDVKIFTLSDELFDSFLTHINRFTEATIKIERNKVAINEFFRLSIALSLFALIYIALNFTALSFAALGVFLFAMLQLGPLASSLNKRYYSFEGKLPHLIRTQDFINELEENEEPTGGDRSTPNDPTPVRFENVSFAYEDEQILNNISFEMQDNEFVAFVGQSGAGKSTIAALLARMYEPDAGRITANDEPIDEFDPDEWREQIAMVRQDPFIFDDTLRYNITIGNPDATEREIEHACEIAYVTEFLDQLPNGLDTELGDNGVRLSGGQRQRVALARALVKDADILILDEATSDLDTGIEQEVQNAIEKMDQDYTILAIAHRLSTVRGADSIYTLEEGQIVEAGDHQNLLEKDGKYAELYATQ